MIIGVSMCDFCGKRTEKFAGRLTLQMIREGRQGLPTIKSWQLCKTCYTKISGINTVGDNIRESIEIQLDKLRADNNNMKMLSSVTR